MLDMAVLAIFPGLMLFAAVSDLLTMTIPNRVSLILVAGFFALALVMRLPPNVMAWHAAAGVFVLAAGFLMFNFGWIGGGDAKLAAATSLWLGFGALASYGVLAAVFGGLLTLGVLALRRLALPAGLSSMGWLARLHDEKSGVPYGIALALAGLVVYPESAIWLTAKAF